jgi:hypothetical protein
MMAGRVDRTGVAVGVEPDLGAKRAAEQLVHGRAQQLAGEVP